MHGSSRAYPHRSSSGGLGCEGGRCARPLHRLPRWPPVRMMPGQSADRRRRHPFDRSPELLSDEGPPIWNGAIPWRGTSFRNSCLSDLMSGRGSGRGMTRGHDQRDRRTQAPPRPCLAAGGLEPAGSPNDFLPAFTDWRFDWLDVPALIRAAGRCFEFPVVDHSPLERWRFQRVTLLGDAAHPMYPLGSNGASQGILDARVLAREIERLDTTPEALQADEAERRPATARIVLANWATAPRRRCSLSRSAHPGLCPHRGRADATGVGRFRSPQ